MLPHIQPPLGHSPIHLPFPPVSRRQRRGSRTKERSIYSRYAAFRGSIPKHQVDGHFGDGSREVSSHAVREELLYSRLRRPLRAAASRRMRHHATAGCRAERSRSVEGAVMRIADRSSANWIADSLSAFRIADLSSAIRIADCLSAILRFSFDQWTIHWSIDHRWIANDFSVNHRWVAVGCRLFVGSSSQLLQSLEHFLSHQTQSLRSSLKTSCLRFPPCFVILSGIYIYRNRHCSIYYCASPNNHRHWPCECDKRLLKVYSVVICCS